MDRRTFGIVAMGAVTGWTGCLSSGTPGSTSTATPTATLPESVTSADFSITAHSENDPMPPTIEYLPEETQVRITGTLWEGSLCDEARLASLSYDDQHDELTATVEVVQDQTGNCPDSLGSATYELLISFQSELPDSVTATHRDVFDETEKTTKENPGE